MSDSGVAPQLRSHSPPARTEQRDDQRRRPWRGNLRHPMGMGILALALMGSSSMLGCRRKPPPDLHLQEGYSLLQSDPKAALEKLSQAKDPSDPKAVLGRGLALEKLRKYPEAEQALQKACAAKPQPICWLALARVKVVLGKLEEARAAIDKVVAQDQTELSAVLLEAYLADDDERARAALSHLEKWREHALGQKPPAAVPAEFYLAQVALFQQLRMRRDFDTAGAQARKAKLSQPRGALGLVELAVKAGRPGLAVELLRKIEEGRPSEEVRRRVAKLAHGLGDHRLTGDILDTLQGNDAEVVTLRAEHEFATGQPGAAATLGQALRLAKVDAERTRLRLLLAEARMRNGQLEEARADAETVFGEQATDSAILLLARLDLAQDAPDAALSRLAPLLARQQVSPQTREIAARAHLALGRKDEARSQLDAILRDQPNQARAARLRVALEVDSQKPLEAIRVAQALVQRMPKDPGLRLLLADAVRKARGPAAAADSLREGARALGEHVGLWMAWVRALEERKADADVLAALEEAHKRLPGEATLTAALAARLAQVGQTERAAELYQELIQGAQGDPIALNNLAMIYADELDDPARAVALAERAHELSQAPPIGDTLGWALYRRSKPGDLARARKLLEAASRALGSPTAKYHLGAVLLETGAESEGKVLLSQALAQADDFPGADHARTLLKTPSPPGKP